MSVSPYPSLTPQIPNAPPNPKHPNPPPPSLKILQRVLEWTVPKFKCIHVCYVMLCYVMLCCVMLCCVYATSRCVVLGWVALHIVTSFMCVCVLIHDTYTPIALHYAGPSCEGMTTHEHISTVSHRPNLPNTIKFQLKQSGKILLASGRMHVQTHPSRAYCEQCSGINITLLTFRFRNENTAAALQIWITKTLNIREKMKKPSEDILITCSEDMLITCFSAECQTTELTHALQVLQRFIPQPADFTMSWPFHSIHNGDQWGMSQTETYSD